MVDDWVERALDELSETSHTYLERALFAEIKEIMGEQTKRLTQAQGELDGRLWRK